MTPAKSTVQFSWADGGSAEFPVLPFAEGRVLLGSGSSSYGGDFAIPGFSGDWLEVDFPPLTFVLDTPAATNAANEDFLDFPRIRFTRGSEMVLLEINC